VSYDLVRGLHILAVIAWMAGLLYLPRLFVYHTKAAPGSEMDLTFQTMERRLYRGIMNPAMIAALVLGLWLFWLRSGGTAAGLKLLGEQPWMAVKLLGVVFLIGWHHVLGAARKRFAAGTNKRSERYWRMTNELPFVAAIIMVLAVTTEFGGH
jgi:putative membrane protein